MSLHLRLFSHVFVSVCTHEYLFYTLDWYPVLSYLLSCSSCSSFGYWELFQVGSGVPWTPIHHPFGVFWCFLFVCLFVLHIALLPAL